MRLVFNLDTNWSLLAALKTAQKFALCQTTKPDDALLVVEHVNGSLHVMLPCADLTYRTRVEVASVEDADGAPLVVNLKTLTRILTGITGEDKQVLFNFDRQGGFLIVHHGTSRWTVPLNKGMQLPEVEDTGEAIGLEFPVKSLHAALRRVRNAVSLESLRPYLRVIDVENGRARACNGTMYAQSDTGIPELTVAISVHLLRPVGSYFEDYAEDVLWFSETAHAFHFFSDRDSVSFAKPNIAFPDMDSLLVRPMRAQVPAVLRVNRLTLKNALSSVGVMSEKDFPAVEIDIEKDSLNIRCSRKSGAEALSTIPCQWGAARRTATFDLGLLKGLLSSVGLDAEETIELRFGNDSRNRKSPVVIEGDRTWSLLNQLR